jgi:hypothetical protein
MDTALWTLDRLQKQNPVKDLEVEFSDKPFRDEGDLVPQGASGFVIRGEKKINLRPNLATDIGMSQVRDDGHFMPAAANVSRVEYYLTHEYGHILDTRTGSRVIDDSLELEDMGALDIGEMSDYGLTNDHEIFAEAYVEWSLTEGATDNAASQYLAKKYFWGENMEKAVGDDEVERIIIIDTFEAGNPPSVKPYKPTAAIIKVAPGLQPVLKHQKGKHDQRSHGRRGSVSPFYDELQESQQQAIDYLMGERSFPPGYSEQGVGPLTTTFAGSIMGKISEARDAVREWRTERASRELRDMTPTELAALGAANRVRAAKRAAGVRSAGRRSPSEWEGPVPSLWSNPFAAPAMAKSADVMQLLYRLFGDVVDVDVWLALVSDPRPVADIDGPLGDLLDDMLDAATPQSVVIKLAPGLLPVFKHQRGKHDQRSHGVWARGRGGAGGDFSEWGDRAERIRAMQDIGPDLTRVARVFQEIKDGNLDEIIEQRVLEDYSELIEERITRNREQIESLSQEGVVEAFGTPAEQFVSALEEQGQSRSEAIEKFREMKLADVERQVKAQAQIDYGYEVRQGIADDLRDRMEPGIREVMEISHPVSIYGTADHVNTTVTVVSVDGIDSGYPVVTIKGTLTNDDGISVGHEWHRELRIAEDSTSAAPKLEAENKYLKLTDEDYQRQGFATTFNERAYDMYIANGMDTVKVGTAWDGGSVWAKRGFDWDDNHGKQNMSVARDALNSILYDPDVPARSRERAARMLDDVNNASGVRDVDMPTPMEIVMIGYQPGVSEWAGHRALFDARWQGEKTLTPTNVAETRSRKDELKVIARQEREVAGQKKLFVPSRESTVGGTIGEPVDVGTQEILDLLEPASGGVPRVRTPEGAAKYGKPIGAPIRAVEKKMSRLDKLQAQMDFYEKWLEETNRELEDDDLAFFAAAAEAMPWLVD